MSSRRVLKRSDLPASFTLETYADGTAWIIYDEGRRRDRIDAYPAAQREAPADQQQDELLSRHIPSAAPRLDTHDTWEPCPSEQVTILGSAEGYAWVRCKRRKGHTLPHKFEMTWSESVSAETAARYPKRPGAAPEQPDTPQPAACDDCGEHHEGYGECPAALPGDPEPTP